MVTGKVPKVSFSGRKANFSDWKPTFRTERPTFRAGDIRGLRRIPSNEPIINKRNIVPSMMLNILNFSMVFLVNLKHREVSIVHWHLKMSHFALLWRKLARTVFWQRFWNFLNGLYGYLIWTMAALHFFVNIENILVKTLIVDLLQRHFPREDVKSISGEGGTK